MTKPGFIKERFLNYFHNQSDDIKQKIVDKYNETRNEQCYCGHTDICDCSHPDIELFLSAINKNYIKEHSLLKLLCRIKLFEDY